MRSIVVLALVAGCGKSSPPDQNKWLELTPMPVAIEVAAGATAAQTQESLDRTAPPGMIVSARECILVVTPGSRGPMTPQQDGVDQQAQVRAEHPDAVFGPAQTDFFAYQYRGNNNATLRSFRYEKTIGETTYRCEPFTGRPDVSCEEAACRSLREGRSRVGAPRRP